MSVRVEVREGETIGQAIRRFNRLVQHVGPPGAGRKRQKWYKQPPDFYVKPCELRRRDEFKDAMRRSLTCRERPPKLLYFR